MKSYKYLDVEESHKIE